MTSVELLFQKIISTQDSIDEMVQSNRMHSANNHVKLAATEVTISTMTTMFKTDIERRANLRGIITDRYGDDDVRAYAKGNLPSSFTFKDMKNKDMRNCVIFKYESDTSNRCIKVFSNGGLHVTGCKRVIDAALDATMVCALLDQIFGSDKKKIEIIDFQIQMLNSNFKVSIVFSRPFYVVVEQEHVSNCADSMMLSLTYILFSISQVTMDVELKLGKEKLDSVGVSAEYKPSEHQGLRINFMRDPKTEKSKVTIFIFSTGSIIMTGCKDMGYLRAAYEFVTNFLESNYDELYLSVAPPRRDRNGPPAKRGRKKKTVADVMDADMFNSFIL